MTAILSTYNTTTTGELFVIYGKTAPAGNYLGEPEKPALPVNVTFTMSGEQYQGQHRNKYWKVDGKATAVIEGKEYTIDYMYDGQDRHPSNTHDALLKIAGNLSKASGLRVGMSDPANYSDNWRWF
jgi:hypothetical protein